MKSYTITFDQSGEKDILRRVNDGFSPVELLGLLELTQIEIQQQMSGIIQPEVTERIVVEEKPKPTQWDDLSNNEKEDLRKKNPELWRKLYRQKYGDEK